MKIFLDTKLFPQYNPVISASELRAKKAEERAKKAEQDAIDKLYSDLGSIKSFALGATPNFTIDLNQDMLKLEDIEQLIVTFGQFGRVVQREILYFSDNYEDEYEVLDSEGHKEVHNWSLEKDSEGYYTHRPWKERKEDTGHIVNGSWRETLDDPLVFDDQPILNSAGNLRHRYQTIRNPKFEYNRIFNKLVLTLSQNDTLKNFKPTDWFYHTEKEPIPDLPFWKNNPSLVMVEVKIRVKRFLDQHMTHQVVIRPQEYFAVADTIEHSLFDDGKPFEGYLKELKDTGAAPIYTPHRFRLFYGDYSVPEDVRSLPQRIDELDYSKQVATAILCRDGLKVSSYPQFTTETISQPAVDSEGNIIMEDVEVKVEANRFFCVAIPLHIKVKVKAVKVLFGGSPSIMDRVSYDSTGLRHGYYEYDSTTGTEKFIETKPGERGDWYNSAGVPAIPRVIPTRDEVIDETAYFQSNYMIDPDGRTPENPMGEFICWYICSKDSVTGNISRFTGPGKYRDDQEWEPRYDFLIQFEEIRG